MQLKMAVGFVDLEQVCLTERDVGGQWWHGWECQKQCLRKMGKVVAGSRMSEEF